MSGVHWRTGWWRIADVAVRFGTDSTRRDLWIGLYRCVNVMGRRLEEVM